MRNRLRIAWSVLHGRPVIFGVSSAEVYFSDAAAMANVGLEINSCDHIKLYVPPGWPVTFEGSTFSDDRPVWAFEHTSDDD